MTKARGSALLMVLIICGAIAGILLATTYTKFQALHMRRAINSFYSFKDLVDAINSPPLSQNGQSCFVSSAAPSLKLCGVAALTKASLANWLIDGRTVSAAAFPAALSALFPSESIPCSGSIRSAERSLTINGRQLSATSAVSPQTCVRSGTLSAHAADNIYFDDIIIYGSTTSTVRGFLEGFKLTVSGDAILIVGGDIFLERLEVLPGASLTLASLTGAVFIAEFAAAGSASIAGREGIYMTYGAASTPAAFSSQLLPAERYIALNITHQLDQ